MDTPKNPRRQAELRKVIEQAAEWFTIFEDDKGEPHERAAFAEWMCESPLHVNAFLNVSAMDRLLETADYAWNNHGLTVTTPDTALRIATLNDPCPEKTFIQAARSKDFQSPRRGFWWSLAAAASVIVALGSWWLTAGARNTHRYSTGIGEQRSVELNDGSIVHLNAKSQLEVRFSAGARELHLLEGEALFRVQRDASRPFRVFIDATVVQAIGTQFDVDRRREVTTIAVVEGAVQVSRRTVAENTRANATTVGAAPAAMRLDAGESVDVAADGKVKRRELARVEEVTAWRERRLVFDEDTLADIAVEFNRYNRTPQLKIEGAVRGRRYAAVFDADDPESLLQFLRKDPDLTMDDQEGAIIVRGR